ncbi:MAG: CoA transferase, partial [Proteobacteria bacterium]|nr:CoA transferase [Pseudomonadota bacterium]
MAGEQKSGALAGVKILDLTDERAIYGAKLLADLGAMVVRPEAEQGDPLRLRGPLDTRTGESLWHAFFASSRSTLTVSPADLKSGVISRLAVAADIVLTCPGAFGVDALEMKDVLADNPGLVCVDCSSFGSLGPWKDYLAPDLVAGALGGAVATTGDVDTPPLKGFGELNFMVSGVYVAIAALGALFYQRATGTGQQVQVPVHQSIASCLEQVFMFYWYSDVLGRPGQRVLPRRGALHWSNAYTVMKARGGSIMITPTPDFDSQLAWLIEEDAHQDLIDPRYSEPENLGLRITRTMEILRTWVADKDVETLFHQAQTRHSPYGWVLPIERVADNPQLQARNWFVDYRVADQTVQGPGAPYHFSATPWALRDPESTDAGDDVLASVGWSRDENVSKSTSPGGRPLEGVRILDFSHVLAGPFA